MSGCQLILQPKNCFKGTEGVDAAPNTAENHIEIEKKPSSTTVPRTPTGGLRTECTF